jgi:hypothetical protein
VKGVKVCEDFFFWVLKGGAQEVKVILGNYLGGGIEIVDFFSIDYQRSMIYIYHVAWKSKTQAEKQMC